MTKSSYYYPITYTSHSDISMGQALAERLGRDEYKKASPLDCILILASYTFFLSAEELMTYFSFFKYHHLAVYLNRLVKSDLLIGDTLYRGKKASYDSRTKKIYGLTKAGFDYVKEKYRPELNNHEYRKLSKRYGCHDYSIGWSFLSMIANPLLPPIGKTESELLFVNGIRTYNFKTEKDVLRIDGKTDILGDTVYLEQDMCTESDDFLRRKFNRYGYHRFNLNRDNASILLSIKMPYVAPADPTIISHGRNVRFSSKHLSSIGQVMDNNKDLFTATAHFEDIHDAIVAGKVPHSPYTDLVEELWIDSEPLYTVRPNDKSKDTDLKLTNKMYAEYYRDSFEIFRSPMYFYEYNKEQEEVFVRKRNVLIENILAGGLVNQSQYSDTLPYDINGYLRCFHLYAGPTSMMDKVCYYVFYNKTGFKGIMENTLEQYFPSIDKGSYRRWFTVTSESPYKKKDAPVNLFCIANYYTSDSWNICIENLAYDVSASVRVKAAVMDFTLERKDNLKGFVIVCLVRNHEEAKYFYDLLGMENVRFAKQFKILFIDIIHVFDLLDKSTYTFDLPKLLEPNSAPLYSLSGGFASNR